MPAGLLRMRPSAAPLDVIWLSTLIVNVYPDPAMMLKVAVQLVLPLTVTLPLEQPVPDQPAKVEPEAAVAVKVTAVAVLKVVAQALPQLIPEGELVTVPLPVPLWFTVTVEIAGGVVAQFSFE